MTKNRRSGKLGRQTIGLTRHRSWRSHLGVLAAVVAISVPVALVSGTAPALAAARVVNGAAEVVPGTTVLSGIACHGHDNCVAVGYESSGPGTIEGVVVPITYGTPGTAELVPGTEWLNAVTCVGPTTCVAVGLGSYYEDGNYWGLGVVVPITNGVPGAVQDAPVGPGMPGAPDEMNLYGVACSTTTSCVAVGSDLYEYGVVVPIKKGSPGQEEVVPGEIANDLYGEACYTTCIAVGPGQNERRQPDAVAVSIDHRAPTNAYFVSGTTGLQGVACRSATSCLLVGSGSGGAVVVPLVDETPRNAEPVSGATKLNGVACRKTTIECLAVGVNGSNQGVVAGINGGLPGDAHAVSGTQVLNGVACPSNTSCLVVGANGSDEGVLAMFRLSR